MKGVAARRQSPVRFDAAVAETRQHGDWQVITAFEGEGEGPWLIDLSHRQRWDYQNVNLDAQSPFGLKVPASPGQVSVQRDLLITRMNGTQVSIWHLGQGESESLPDDIAFTEMTDAHCMLAVVGGDTPSVIEQICNLDLFDPQRMMPFLTQGPVMHIPCQVVTLNPECVLMTFSRGYGQTFANSMLHAAESCKLNPGGEARFNNMIRENFAAY
jgi:hypothetical protein